MEENKKDELIDQESVTNNPAPAVEAAAEPKSEEAKPAPARPAAKPRKKGMSFAKVFLAALLAVVAGGAVTVFFFATILSGVTSFVQPKAKGIPAEAILHINLAESLIDAPSNDPRSSFDIMSMSATS